MLWRTTELEERKIWARIEVQHARNILIFLERGTASEDLPPALIRVLASALLIFRLPRCSSSQHVMKSMPLPLWHVPHQGLKRGKCDKPLLGDAFIRLVAKVTPPSPLPASPSLLRNILGVTLMCLALMLLTFAGVKNESATHFTFRRMELEAEPAGNLMLELHESGEEHACINSPELLREPLWVVVARLAVSCSQELHGGDFDLAQAVDSSRSGEMTCEGCPQCVKQALSCDQVRFSKTFGVELERTKAQRETKGSDLPVVWISAIIKNEANLAVSWVFHHWMIGVQKILLYDNGSVDHIKEAMKVPIEAGFVELIDHPGEAVQNLAYQRALERSQDAGGISFCAFIDVDEFIILDETSATLPEVMKHFDGKGSDVGAVSFNWRFAEWMSGLDRWDRFALSNVRMSTTLHWQVKSLARVRFTRFVNSPHFPRVKRGFHQVDGMNRKISGPVNTQVLAKPAYILHLRRRGLEGWIRKRMRGDAAIPSGTRKYFKACPMCLPTASLDDVVNEFQAGLSPLKFAKSTSSGQILTNGTIQLPAMEAASELFRSVADIHSCSCGVW